MNEFEKLRNSLIGKEVVVRGRASPLRPGVQAMTLPDCMMPDGADPCRGYHELRAEVERLQAALDIESAMVAFHQKNEQIKNTEVERLKAENEKLKMLVYPRMIDKVERLMVALKEIEWSNDSKWQSERARAALERKP